jgi:phenylpropionate dioxygenase-like ring-hydroxylating dioxygenase large terminal subunit
MRVVTDLPVPFGWFQVAWPDDLAPGAVQPLFAFGRHLVLWRDVGGVPHLHDAFCPHLGAHLGHGGRVDGTTIVCPFHGWGFDGDGHHCMLPAGELPEPPPPIRTYPVMERNGLLMAWYHPEDHPPTWEIPEVPELADPGHVTPRFREFVVAAPLQEMAENGADSAHFGFVHGQAIVPSIDSYETDGPVARMRSTQRWPTGDGVVDAFVEATSHGPGFSVIRMTGIIDTVSVGCNTPVSGDRCHLRFSFTVRKLDDPAMTAMVGDAFIDLLTEQIQEDIRIWEHKRYLPHPALAGTDGPIMQFRAWASQFYAGNGAGV